MCLYRAELGVGLSHPLLEGGVGWVGAQRLPCLLEVPHHRGVVEAKARGNLCHRLPRPVECHRRPPAARGGSGCPPAWEC